MKNFMPVKGEFEGFQKKMKNSYKKPLSKIIGEIREALLLTQEDFGALIGRTGRNIAGWEGGETVPNERVLRLISQILQVRMEFLETGQGNMFENGSMFALRAHIVSRINAIEKQKGEEYSRDKKRTILKETVRMLKEGIITLESLDGVLESMMKLAS